MLTAAQVGAVTGLEVTAARRTPSIIKLVEAQREGREAGPGRLICVYQTASRFGGITIAVPPPGERSAASYRAARDEYFSRFAARRVSGLGQDAWFAGGSALTVLARDDLYFVVATQMAQLGSEAVVVALARAVLARLGE